MARAPLERLDLFLAKTQGVSRKKVKKLLDEGAVRLNGRKVVIASWKVRDGDRVEVINPKLAEPSQSAEGFYLKVLYEDDALLVVEKDAGIACEPSPQIYKPTLVEIINAYLRRKEPHLKHHYIGLIHRLDTDTSGIMVYSKKKEANRLVDQFKSHKIRRTYLTLVEGRLEKEEGKISLALEKYEGKGGKKVRIAPPKKGRPAVTHFRVIERYGKATLLEVSLNTGRTHQIRVHLASQGHPLVGEKIYRDPLVKMRISFKHHVLHASFLEFRHPVTGQKMQFKSELPRDLRKLVDRLRIGA